MKTAIVAALLTLAPIPVLAQAVSPATSGTMTSADVGVSPIASQSGPNYVLAAADANLYQIKAAQLAATRAQRDDVKAYACLLYTSPSPRDRQKSRMPSSA